MYQIKIILLNICYYYSTELDRNFNYSSAEFARGRAVKIMRHSQTIIVIKINGLGGEDFKCTKDK